MRDTNAGIVDVDTQVLATPSTADQDASLRGVFDGVRDQVLDQTTQQPSIGADHQSTGHKREFEPFRRCERRELELNLPQHFIDTEIGEFRPHCPGIKTRHIQERAEDFLNGFERSIDIVDQAAVVLSSTLNEAGDIKSCSIKWLQDVVTCRREELGLGDIRGFGLTFGTRERH